MSTTSADRRPVAGLRRVCAGTAGLQVRLPVATALRGMLAIAIGAGAVLSVLSTTACGSSQSDLVGQGNRAFEEGDFDAATQRYQRAEVEAPDLSQPYYNAGNSLLRQDKPEDAVRHLEQALRTAGPELGADAAFNLGNAYFESGDYDAAAQAYADSLRLAPEELDAKHNLELALQRMQQDRVEPQESPEPEEQGEGEDEDQPDPQEQREEDQAGDETDSSPTEQQEVLTEEQAHRLLEALSQDADTLEQRLQFGTGQSLDPAQDW